VTFSFSVRSTVGASFNPHAREGRDLMTAIAVEPRNREERETRQATVERINVLDDEILRLRAALARLPDVLDDGVYTKGETRLAYAHAASQENREVLVSSQIIQAATAKMGEAFFNRLSDGTVKVVGELKAEQRQYTFTLVDERGTVLQTIMDNSSPIHTSMNLERSNNIHNYLGRSAKQD
jgi:hypothetical protein